MVSVATYGKAKLQQRFGYPRGPQYRACLQALPVGCYLARERLYSGNGDEDIRATLSAKNLHQWTTPEAKITKGCIFSSLQHISQVLHEYIGGSDDSPSPNIDNANVENILDLSLVHLVQSQLRPLDQQSPGSQKNELTFLQNISDCVADVMAVSLFNSAEPRGVQLCFGSKTPRRFNKTIHYLLLAEETSITSVDIILQWAVTILGHDIPEPGVWAMSSRYDQTVYPQIFSTQELQREGILTLECVPGVLIWNEQQYNYVRISEDLILRASDYVNTDDLGLEVYKEESSINERVKFASQAPVFPHDNFPDLDLEWRVLPTDTCLEIVIAVPRYPSLPSRDPSRVLNAAAQSLFVDCKHDRNTSFVPQTENIYRTSPLQLEPEDWEPNKDSVISIVQCDGNEKARFYALTASLGGIIRMDSCIECCVQRAGLVPGRFVVC
ncbi:MAG: hypothetical protein Q9222_005096 [Ikaeria aurantiellina]